MKRTITAIALGLSLASCSKKQNVEFTCTGGSGSYTMTYNNGTGTEQKQTNKIVYTLKSGEYALCNAMDRNGQTFTYTLTVDGKTERQETGTFFQWEYTND